MSSPAVSIELLVGMKPFSVASQQSTLSSADPDILSLIWCFIGHGQLLVARSSVTFPADLRIHHALRRFFWFDCRWSHPSPYPEVRVA